MGEDSRREQSPKAGDDDEDGDRPLVVVSNREPYVHVNDGDGDGVEVETPVGGLTATLDPVLRRCGGTWVAWGSGDADDTVVDGDGAVAVPPDDPAYTLRRVFLEEEAVAAYYDGFSNAVLWPLLHADPGRVAFEPRYWQGYVDANERFADAVADATTPGAVVWAQDYHLCLLAERLDPRVPESVTLSQFLHVPWPPAELFAVCPHGTELLAGLLANDLLGFHLERYRANFLDTVERALPEASVDREAGVVVTETGRTRLYAHPVGVDEEGIPTGSVNPGVDGSDPRQRTPRTSPPRESTLRSRYGIADGRPVAVGVDRLDYTKGVLERLRALEHLWETTPDLRGAFTHLTVSTPTRERVPAYREYRDRVGRTIDRLNDRFGTDDWTPVEHVAEPVDRADLFALYRLAGVALVTPLRDGLNLVALEYALANRGDDGVLVLSEFAGAAELLECAMTVNPYDVGAMATTVARSVRMDDEDRRAHAERTAEAAAEWEPSEWLDAHSRLVSEVRPPVEGPGGSDA